MLLIGNPCITDDEARTQMAIWSVVAAPLIMGNDLRTVPASAKAILLNPAAIAIDQDQDGVPGTRLTPYGVQQEVWSRALNNGDVAVALLNSGDDAAANITVNFKDIGLAKCVVTNMLSLAVFLF